MTAASSSHNAYPWHDPMDPRRWLFAGLAAMFVLIGVSVLVAVLTSGPPAVNWGSWSWNGSNVWGWAIGIVVFVLVIWIFVSAVRAIFWGLGWGYPYRRYYRRYARWGMDPAYSTARDRYARGEINSEQYAQIVNDLDRHGPGAYP